MAKENETVADIIAWLRRPREGENGYLTAWRDEIADRLEAAHRRERGDCAKLREACIYALAELEHFRKCHDARLHFCDIVHVGNAKHALKTALAAPARNCDMFGSYTIAKEEWWKTEVLPRVYGVVSGAEPPFADWLFAPATEREGGKDADE